MKNEMEILKNEIEEQMEIYKSCIIDNEKDISRLEKEVDDMIETKEENEENYDRLEKELIDLEEKISNWTDEDERLDALDRNEINNPNE
jgi:hypothetical protein